MEGIVKLACSLSEGDLDVANDYTSKSTRFQKWGYDRQFIDADGNKRVIKEDSILAAAWGRLSDDQQSLVKGIFERRDNMFLRKFELAEQAGVGFSFFQLLPLKDRIRR